jgi:hypothetical protein
MRKEFIFLNGPRVRADVKKDGILGIHKAPLKGYVVTHLPTQRVVLWTRLQRKAVAARKKLEKLDWSDIQSNTLKLKVREISCEAQQE